MRRSTPALILVCAWLSACGGEEAPPPAADAATLRSVESGELIGFSNPAGGHTWLGIPFAKPPIGDLRWLAPRPAASWEGTLEALAFGDACVQIASPVGTESSGDGDLGGSEDCLTLNIYAPNLAPGEIPKGILSLPVMVWIHGGGNSQGSAALYDGSILANERRVLVVSVQYRLGAFGWFRHPALHGDDASADDISGNYGTLDAIAALEWVRDNIAAFGGDPDRVTIFGESAGGSNVLALLRSPRATGLFHRAIAQSGSARSRTIADAENYTDDKEPGNENSSSEVFLRLLQNNGRADDRAAAKAAAASMPNHEIASLLRATSATELVDLYPRDRLGAMYHNPRILQDGAVLSALPALEAYAQGEYNRVPTILGGNRDEVRLFNVFSSRHVRRLFGLPIGMKNLRMYEATADFGSRAWKAVGVDEPATSMRARQGASVYGYRFDWDHEPDLLWIDAGRWLGAAHAFEIPFVFGNLSLGSATRLVFDPGHAELDHALSDAMTSYWTQFAYTGDPGVGRDGKLTRWEPWDASGGSFLALDTSDGDGIHMSDDTITLAEVIASVARDPRLESPAERCEVYRDLARGGRSLSFSDYAKQEGGACVELLPAPERN